MEFRLSLILIIFALIWIVTISLFVAKNKLSVKYSLIWLLASIFILLVGISPNIIQWICGVMGIQTISNFLIGIVITLLLIITLLLTIIITYQKKQIIYLIQEVSLLKKNNEKK